MPFGASRKAFECIDKVDTLSKDKRNRSGKALALRFSPDPPFSAKTSSANGFSVAYRWFSFKVSLRRHMSACVT